MFMRISNLQGKLHAPEYCEREQEICPSVDSPQGSPISIKRNMIRTGGPIRVTDPRCTPVYGWRFLFIFLTD